MLVRYGENPPKEPIVDEDSVKNYKKWIDTPIMNIGDISKEIICAPYKEEVEYYRDILQEILDSASNDDSCLGFYIQGICEAALRAYKHGE